MRLGPAREGSVLVSVKMRPMVVSAAKARAELEGIPFHKLVRKLVTEYAAEFDAECVGAHWNTDRT